MVKVMSLLIKTVLRLKVEFGSVLESELGQKWRYGVLKACLG